MTRRFVLVGSVLAMAILLSCGATPFPGVPPLTTEPTFNAVQTTILTPACVRCHSSDHAAGSVSVSTYDDLMASAGAVVPFQPYQSQLFMQCYHGDMPDDGTPLTTVQLQLLYGWIANGAHNN